MPNRYSMRLRPIWGDDEPTGGELIQQGIGDAIGAYLTHKQASNEFADKVSMAGGTVDPQPTWRDRLSKIRHPFGGGEKPMTTDQIHQGFVDRQVKPSMTPIVPDRPSVTLPPGVTPISPAGAHMEGGQWVLDGRTSQRGVAGALRPLYDTNSHNYPNQDGAETYTMHGPNGQVAHIPFVSPRELAAAEASQRAKRSEFEYETKYKTDEAIREARESAPYKTSGGLTFEQRQQLAKEDDDRYLANRLRLEGLGHSNAMGEIRERARLRVDGGSSDDGGINSKETSRGNALVSAGNRLMDEATDKLTGDIKDKAAYERGRRLMDQGTRLLGEEPAPKGYARAPEKQTPEAARAAAQEISADARERFPNASPQAIKNYVRNVMRRAGWKVQ